MVVLDALNAAQRTLFHVVLLLALILASVALGSWLAHKDPEPSGEWTKPKQDSRIADTGTETIKPQDCAVVVAKPGAKKKLDLPPEIQADPKKHVTTAVIIPSNERPQSVVSIFNESTGTTDMLTQRLAYPWLAIEQRGQLWLGYGLTPGGDRVGRILIREDLLQIKAMHLGMNASIDTDGAWFAGVGVAYRW